MNYITGDTHGKKWQLVDAIKMEKLTNEDRLFICGDFGFVWELEGTQDYRQEKNVLNYLSGLGCEILFIDGNHENFDRLLKYPEEIRYGNPVGIIRHNIIHLKRGYVYIVDGKKIFTLGGATSEDKNRRIINVSWWKEENYTYEDLDKAAESLLAVNGEVDFIITHTAPKQAEKTIEFGIRQQYGDTGWRLLNHGEVKFLTLLHDTIKFKEWHFGHFHIDTDDGTFFCHYTRINKFF